MDKIETNFHVTKNLLDSEYSKMLSYATMGIVIIATLTISLSVFFLEAKNIGSFVGMIFAGIVSSIVFGKRFTRSLDEISGKITKLKV